MLLVRARGPAGAALLVHGKGGKLRVVPVGDDLAAAIAADGADGYLFPGDENGRTRSRRSVSVKSLTC